MKKLWVAVSVAALCTGAQAQINGLDPANLPPAGFEGREYTDAAGCAFLRSSFGGQVTWVPRYGPDRNPVCGLAPTDFANVSVQTPQANPAETPQSTQANTGLVPDQDAGASAGSTSTMTGSVAPAERPVAQPAPQRGRIEVLGAVIDPTRRSAPGFLGKEPATKRVAQRRNAPRATPKARFPQADSSGRHPSCPSSAPFGQLVDTELGRKMVRCVISPSLFLDAYVTSPKSQAASPRNAGHGARIQVGSFAVAGNANRLAARLKAQGYPASIHRAQGLQVVSVGPFASASAAQKTLSQMRALGFRDAFLRR